MNRNAIACFLGIGLTAALSGQTPPSCPAVNKSVKLTSNCVGPLAITADNVFLDLGGKTVSCNSANPWIGIDVTDRRKVRIENGNVTDCGRGLNLIGGGGHIVKKVNLRRVNTPIPNRYYGIYSEGSAQNTFESVVAEGNDVGADLTRGSYENTMKGVKLNRNALDGLQLDYDATDNEIKDSEFNENGRFGVYFGPRSARNVLFQNQINKNGWLGANPDSTNVLQKNVLKGNGFTSDAAAWLRGGIILMGTNNIILENEAAENNGDGIAAGLPYNQEAVSNGIWKNKTGKNKGLDLADYPAGLCTENDWGGNSAGTDYDRCEKTGGDPPKFHVMGSGKIGEFTYQFNAQRRSAGPATGKAKAENVPDGLGVSTAAKVEGRVTCLMVDPVQSDSATLGMIIDKSSDPERVPPYSTLHLFVKAGGAVTADGTVADLVVPSNANQYGPGDCPLPESEVAAAASIGTRVKGKVAIVVK